MAGCCDNMREVDTYSKATMAMEPTESTTFKVAAAKNFSSARAAQLPVGMNELGTISNDALTFVNVMDKEGVSRTASAIIFHSDVPSASTSSCAVFSYDVFTIEVSLGVHKYVSNSITATPSIHMLESANARNAQHSRLSVWTKSLVPSVPISQGGPYMTATGGTFVKSLDANNTTCNFLGSSDVAARVFSLVRRPLLNASNQCPKHTDVLMTCSLALLRNNLLLLWPASYLTGGLTLDLLDVLLGLRLWCGLVEDNNVGAESKFEHGASVSMLSSACRVYSFPRSTIFSSPSVKRTSGEALQYNKMIVLSLLMFGVCSSHNFGCFSCDLVEHVCCQIVIDVGIHLYYIVLALMHSLDSWSGGVLGRNFAIENVSIPEYQHQHFAGQFPLRRNALSFDSGMKNAVSYATIYAMQNAVPCAIIQASNLLKFVPRYSSQTCSSRETNWASTDLYFSSITQFFRLLHVLLISFSL